VSCDPWLDLPVAPVNRLDLRHSAPGSKRHATERRGWWFGRAGTGRRGKSANDRSPLYAGRNLFEQFQPFHSESF